MITREFLVSNGFSHYTGNNQDDYERNFDNGYATVRFSNKDPNEVNSIYVYHDVLSGGHIRKVVISGAKVTKDDLMTALKLCHLA